MNRALPSPLAHHGAAWLSFVMGSMRKKLLSVSGSTHTSRTNQWQAGTGVLWLRCDKRTQVTIERLEAALDLVAECTVMHNRPQFAPYMERLEREIAALRSKDDVMERARRRLDERGRDLTANKVAKQHLVSQ